MSNPVMLFEPRTFTDIMLAAIACDVEISGLAKVRKEGDTYIAHGNIVIFNQGCSVSGTHLDPGAVNSWLHKMITSGRSKELPLFRLWWHSHVMARTRPSSTDRGTMQNVWQPVHDWEIMMIVNKFQSIYLEIDVFKPEPRQLYLLENIEFTEKFSKQDFENMLKKRYKRISKIVSSKVTDLTQDNEQGS